MAKIEEFSKLSLEFAGSVDFAVVYVEEAHPLNGWNFQVSHLSLATYLVKIKRSQD